MRKRFLVLFFLLFLSLSTSGCAPTYPKEHITESLEALAEKEKGIAVKAYLKGRTLTVYFPMEALLDEESRVSRKVFGIMDDVDFISRRVILSSDADIKFLRIGTVDEDAGFEFTIVRNADDIKRFRYMDISRGEASRRVYYSLGLNPSVRGANAVKEIIDEMNDRILDMRTVRLDEDTALIYARASRGRYLYLADRRHLPNIIKDKYDLARPFPVKFSEYSDIESWPSTYADINDVRMEWFLAKQAAARIKERLGKDSGISDSLRVLGVEGSFIDGRFLFTLNLFPRNMGKDTLGAAEDALKAAAYVVSYVIHGYGFADFDYVHIADNMTKKSMNVKRDELEHNYYRKSKKIMRRL